MLRAANDGPLRILLPMISTASEIRRVREAVDQVARRLRRRGVRLLNPLPPLGAMIEVPGAALAADALARRPIHPAVLRLRRRSAAASHCRFVVSTRTSSCKLAIEAIAALRSKPVRLTAKTSLLV